MSSQQASEKFALPAVGDWVNCPFCDRVCQEQDPRTGRWQCSYREDCPGLRSAGSSPDTTDTDRESLASYPHFSSVSPASVSSACSTPTFQSTSPAPPNTRRSSRASAGSRTKQHKNSKERANRGGLQIIAQLHQDTLCYVNEDGKLEIGKLQSANNAATSGLVFKKHDVQIAHSAICIGLFEEACKEATRNGKNLEFNARMRAYVKRAILTGDPRTGSWLEDNEPPCSSGPGPGKACIVHGNPNWAHCRAERNWANFQAGMNNFKTSLRNRSRM